MCRAPSCSPQPVMCPFAAMCLAAVAAAAGAKRALPLHCRFVKPGLHACVPPWSVPQPLHSCTSSLPIMRFSASETCSSRRNRCCPLRLQQQQEQQRTEARILLPRAPLQRLLPQPGKGLAPAKMRRLPQPRQRQASPCWQAVRLQALQQLKTLAGLQTRRQRCWQPPGALQTWRCLAHRAGSPPPPPLPLSAADWPSNGRSSWLPRWQRAPRRPRPRCARYGTQTASLGCRPSAADPSSPCCRCCTHSRQRTARQLRVRSQRQQMTLLLLLQPPPLGTGCLRRGSKRQGSTNLQSASTAS